MEKKLKVSVINGDESVLRDPIMGRPFSHNLDRIEYTESKDEADAILLYLRIVKCNEDFDEIKHTDEFNKYADKCFCFAQHDRPKFAYSDKRVTKFIGQPLEDWRVNEQFKIIPVPINMNYIEWEMTKNKDFIKKCRNEEKLFNFCFFGRVNYEKRKQLLDLDLDKYDYEEITRSVFNIHKQKVRVKMNNAFCLRLGRSKYALAPRGIGSSSFRLYQAMMAGTVPIESGMKDYPFKELVDWDKFCIRGDVNYKSLPISGDAYYELRDCAIKFWEDYVYIPSCDRKIFEHYVIPAGKNIN